MSLHLTRRVLLPLGIAASVSACGGGGSSGPPPPNPLYVNAATGSDTNAGDQANPLASVSKAAQVALSAYQIIVAPGIYQGGITTNRQGKVPQGVQFIADTSGDKTGTTAGPVTIDATGLGAGFNLSSSSAAAGNIKAMIDGFTITNASDAGIVIKSGSDDLVIQNCMIHDNPGDGIRVQDSARVLVFNNLVYDNGGDGIALVGPKSGSPSGRLYNNTIVRNDGHGITIGTTDHASPGAWVLNNIVQDNDATLPSENMKAFTSPSSQSKYNGNCNLVFLATYNPSYLQGPDDVASAALFVNPPTDFHLLSSSPAIDRSDMNNCALAGLGPSQENILLGRTTTGTNSSPGVADKKPYDLGFHFLRH